MTYALDMSDCSDCSDSSDLLNISANTCARDLKFSPDPDQTKRRPKPEKKLVQLELVQVLYCSTCDLNLKLRQNLQIEPYPYSDLFKFGLRCPVMLKF